MQKGHFVKEETVKLDGESADFREGLAYFNKTS